MRVLVEQQLEREATRSARCILEPGRFLVGEAGIYLCRIHDIKESRGVKYVITDGGLHQHLAATGNLMESLVRCQCVWY